MKRLAMTVAFAGALLAGAGALARESPPPLGQPHPFALPAKHEMALPNGLAVTLVPFGTVPKTTILVTTRTGNVADGDKSGLCLLYTSPSPRD